MKNGIMQWLETRDLDFSKREPGDYTPKTGWEDEDSTHHHWMKMMREAIAEMQTEQKTQ